MKGFMQWFRSSSKMKRWMLLILIGIVLTCYGMAEVLVMKEMSFQEVGKVVAIFVVGFLSIIIGLVCLNKRTLEVLVESTDERMENKKNVNVKSLIFNKKVYDQGPNIVVIGGGTGLNTVLVGLKKYTNNLTAIVTVSDYGEGASNSRKELDIPPFGDIKDSIISLAEKENQLGNLLNYQFTEGVLKGLSFSDIYFSAMNGVNGDYTDAIMKSDEVFRMIGKVLPVTLDEMNITAELANGYVVTEKSKIPEIVYDKVTKINRIYLNPSNCKPAPGVIDAIKEADCIVIGPGSLYTNVIPNLLVGGIAKAIKEAAAIKVYISNIMTEPGQTDNYSVSDHLNAIIEHCGKGVVDYCIYDTGEVIPEFIKKYNLQGQDLVEQDIDKIKGITFLQRNLSMVVDGYIRHDPNLVASSVIELICDDLKYQDKQNDPQYLMLNNKLREDKRIQKIQKQMEKKEKKHLKDPKGKSKHMGKSKSKFSNKYSDRIASIKEADEKVRRREEKEKADMRRREAKRREARRKDEKKKEARRMQDKKRGSSLKLDLAQAEMERIRKRKEIERNGETNNKKMSSQEIREEMIKELQNSKLK